MVSVQIEQALAQVSDRRRTVLVEVHLRGRPVAEVDAELGAPPGRVHSWLYYSLRALGVVLEEGGLARWTMTTGASASSSGALARGVLDPEQRRRRRRRARAWAAAVVAAVSALAVLAVVVLRPARRHHPQSPPIPR